MAERPSVISGSYLCMKVPISSAAIYILLYSTGSLGGSMMNFFDAISVSTRLAQVIEIGARWNSGKVLTRVFASLTVLVFPVPGWPTSIIYRFGYNGLVVQTQTLCSNTAPITDIAVHLRHITGASKPPVRSVNDSIHDVNLLLSSPFVPTRPVFEAIRVVLGILALVPSSPAIIRYPEGSALR